MTFRDLLELRDWLQFAVETQGAQTTAGGVGLGAADIEIKLEGQRYEITIRPLKD